MNGIWFIYYWKSWEESLIRATPAQVYNGLSAVDSRLAKIMWLHFFSSCLVLYPLTPRLQLAQHGGIGGLCTFLRGDGGSLLPLHGWTDSSFMGGWVCLLPHLARPVFLCLLVLSARGFSQSGHFQEFEKVSGGVYGDPDVHRLHPGEGAAQTGSQRCWDLITCCGATVQFITIKVDVLIELLCTYDILIYLIFLQYLVTSFKIWGIGNKR